MQKYVPVSFANIPVTQTFPLFGEATYKEEWATINIRDCKEDMRTNKGLARCINQQLIQKKASFGYGGYLEQRSIYRRSPHFSLEEAREWHLGIDVWCPVGQRVYVPYAAKLHSMGVNDAPYDYGATIILEHECDGQVFYTLYGHLQRKDLEIYKEGQALQAGLILCHVGDTNDNGGWVPHLHFQVIKQLEGKRADYPGVCAKSRLPYYRENCPDPTPFLQLPQNASS